MDLQLSQNFLFRINSVMYIILSKKKKIFNFFAKIENKNIEKKIYIHGDLNDRYRCSYIICIKPDYVIEM